MVAENAIFISYRRSDSNDVTGRICDHLKAHFGDAAVFIDYDGIPYGADFPEHLQQTVDGAEVLLAMIGPTWLKVLKDRMDKPKTDWVRSEIERALGQQIVVIPVLVSGSQVPESNDLPVSLQALSRSNAAQARAGADFEIDAQRLIQRLEEIVGVCDVDSAPREWSGAQLEGLQTVLMEAYPTESKLKRLLRTELDLKLNTLAGGENYSEVVFSLIESLEAESRLLEMVKAAKNKSGNLKLRNFVDSLPRGPQWS